MGKTKCTNEGVSFLTRTKNSVYKKAKRLGLTKKVRNLTEEDIKLLVINQSIKYDHRIF